MSHAQLDNMICRGYAVRHVDEQRGIGDNAREQVATGTDRPFGKTEQRIGAAGAGLLGAADGKSNNALAKELKTSRPTVLDWRERFAEGGIKALYDDRPRGRSFKPLARTKEAGGDCQDAKRSVAGHTMELPQHGQNLRHQRIRTASLACQRLEAAFLPRRSSCPTIRTFIQKLKNVVGLYMNPPDHALVLCIDEKSQIQAFDCRQPGLPMKKGRAGTMTHDYKRNGTTTLFAALDVLKGEVIGRCMPQHRHQEFLKFLKAIDSQHPPNNWTFTALPTTTRPTRNRKLKTGSPNIRASTSISFQPRHRG